MSALDFKQYQRDFCAHARNPRLNPRPSGVNARRMAVYADLLFNNIDSTLRSCFPVCMKVLGIRKWTRLVREFLAQHSCATPLFRQIPEEFLQWLSTASPQGLPPFLSQLAHYEWVELAIAVFDAPYVQLEGSETDLIEGVPVWNPAMMLLRYDWPVQRISPRFKPTQPLDTPVFLLVFRNADDEVKFNELNPVSAQLIERLQAGDVSGRAALLQIAEALHHPDPEQIVAFGHDLLQTLRVNGAILGANPL